MSITIKNPKSADELAGHIQKNGIDILNAGAVTGAKKSIFKFNDMTVPVPGTNLQVKVKPQESHTFSAGANSLAGIALNNISKELGAGDSDTPPTPTENVIYIMVDTSSGTNTISCETPYSDISKMVGNIKAIVQFVMGSEQTVLEANTEDKVDDFHKAVLNAYIDENGDTVEVTPGDIIFYFPNEFAGEMLLESCVITPDNTWHNGYTTISAGSFYKVSYNDGLEISKIDSHGWKGETDEYKYVMFDQSALARVYNKLSVIGCTEYKRQKFSDNPELDAILNIYALTLGQYCNYLGTKTYTSYRIDGNKAYTAIVANINKDYYGDPVSIGISVSEDNITLTETDFNLPDSVDTYDVEFSFDGDYAVTSTPSITSLGANDCAKLSSGESEDYEVYLPRTAYVTTLYDDVNVTNPKNGNTVTVPSGTNVCIFEYAFYVVDGDLYEVYVWYDTDKWVMGLYK